MPAPAATGLEGRLKLLITAGTAAGAVGTALLHGLGYVSLRFHLRALGVDTDVELLDERFLFEGANFLIYLLATLPTLLLLLLPLALLAWLLRRPLRALRDAVALRLTPLRLALLAGLWAVLAVQLVMRQAFDLRHLLLQPTCRPAWLWAVLRDEPGVLAQLFFAALLLLTLPTLVALVHLWRHRLEPALPAALALLAALAFVQLMLLPVGHGALQAGSDVPRILALPGEPESSRIWQVWQSEDKAAFLVVRPGNPQVRRLMLLPAGELDRLEVLRHDDLVQVLAKENPLCVE